MHLLRCMNVLRHFALKLYKLQMHQNNLPNNSLHRKIKDNLNRVKHILSKGLENDKYKYQVNVLHHYLVILNNDETHDSDISTIRKHYRYIYFDGLGLDKCAIYSRHMSIHQVIAHFYSTQRNKTYIVLNVFPCTINGNQEYCLDYISVSQLKAWYSGNYHEIHISNLAQLIAVDSLMISNAFSCNDESWLSLAKSNFNELKYNLYLGMNGGVSPYSNNAMQSFQSNLEHNGGVPVIGLNHIANRHELVQILVRLMYLQDLFDAITLDTSLDKCYQKIQNTNFYIYYDLIHSTKHFIYLHTASSQDVIRLFQKKRNASHQYHILSVDRLHYYNENKRYSIGPIEIVTYMPLSLFHPIDDIYHTYGMLKS